MKCNFICSCVILVLVCYFIISSFNGFEDTEYGDGVSLEIDQPVLSGDSDLPILLDELHCPLGSTSLSQCSHNGWGRHDCSHDEDVYLECNYTNDSENILLYITVTVIVNLFHFSAAFQFRLAGNIEGEGRLDVFYNETWGTLCVIFFNDNVGEAICSSLNHTG